MSHITHTTAPQPGSHGEVKANGVHYLLWLLVIAQYGALISIYALEPILTQTFRGRPIDPREDWFGAGFSIVVCWMLSFGIRSMRHFLKPLSNQMLAKQWSIGAATLSLPSAYVNSLIFVWLTRDVFLHSPTVSSLVVIVSMVVTVVAGFYMPFVLFTCWLKYRYREDEY